MLRRRLTFACAMVAECVLHASALHAQGRASVGALSPASERIRAVARAIADHVPDAGANFWRTVAASSSPLVEPVTDDSTLVKVTFVWRAGSDSVQSVTVAGGGAEFDYLRSRLTLIRGTDIWYVTHTLPADSRFTYRLFVNDSATGSLVTRPLVDPLNRQEMSSQGQAGSLFEGPAAPSLAWSQGRDDVPRGTVHRDSIVSKAMHEVRYVSIYTPASYDRTRDRNGLVVLFDGEAYGDGKAVPTPRILDNLIAARRIKPVVAVFIDNLPNRRQTDLGYSDDFTRFVGDELVTWLRSRYRVSAAPRDAAICGSSLGGSAAAYVALRFPKVFGNVLSQSGAYWWPRAPDPEPEWLARHLVTRPHVPVRFSLDVGTIEPFVTRDHGPGLLTGNRHLRDMLLATGYDVVRYREVHGGHEPVSWRLTLPEGLIALLGIPQ